jgi:hypothetical protein
MFIVVLTACANQPPKIANTTWPQAVVNAPKDELHDRFISVIASAGASIDDSSESVIQARVPDGVSKAKAFFGCVSCADPYIKTNVILSSVPDGTQVVVQYWRIVPQYYGSEIRMEVEQNADFNQWQQILWNLRDQYNKK